MSRRPYTHTCTLGQYELELAPCTAGPSTLCKIFLSILVSTSHDDLCINSDFADKICLVFYNILPEYRFTRQYRFGDNIGLMCNWNHTPANQAMLKCSQPSTTMPLHHICKAIHFLFPVLVMPSHYYAFLIRRIFTRTWLRYVRVFAVAIPSVRLSSVCLSVTLVHPTQGVEPFGKISSPLCTLAILWPPCKFLRR